MIEIIEEEHGTTYRTASGVLELDQETVRILTLADDTSVRDNEIVSWTKDEWEEDPTVTPVIANAIALFFARGAAAVAQRSGKDFDSNGDVTYPKAGGTR